MNDNQDDTEPALKAEDFDLSPAEIREELEMNKYKNDFRPTYDPEWGDGQIHLDGEKDFPRDQPGDEAEADMMERCEIVGGLCTSGDGYFTVTSQYGALVYRCYYPEPGEPVDRIEFIENDGYTGEEQFRAEYDVDVLVDVDTFLKTFLRDCVEWTIEPQGEPTRIQDL
jgi:hypothetical protein